MIHFEQSDDPTWAEKEYPLLVGKEYEKEYPLVISDSSMMKQNGNSSPLPMSTFGKDARQADFG